MPDPALTSEVHRNVYLLPRSIQLNQTVTILPVLRLPSLLRPHLSVVLWSQAENADEAFKVELWADFNDHEKHRVAFGRYPSNDMKLESLIPIGVTNWSYMSVVSKAIEITLRGPPYQSNSLHIWAKDRQSFAEELGHAIITPGSKGPTRSLKTETGPHGTYNYTSQEPFVHAKPHWATEEWTVPSNGVAVISGPSGPGRSNANM